MRMPKLKDYTRLKTTHVVVAGVLCLSLSAFAAKDPQDPNLKHMQSARSYFQQNKLDQAIEEYDRVTKDSDFWLEAQEEKAHTLGRKGEYDKTISTLKTVTADIFNGVVGPEPYFVLALTNLKTCDYPSVFSVTKAFKSRFADRIKSLESLTKSESELVQGVLNTLNQKGQLSPAVLGSKMKSLPRNFHRDSRIQLLAKQVATPTRDQLLTKRLKELADRELKEIDQTISKLQVLEADTIQRIYVLEHSKNKRPKLGDLKKGKDELSFPVAEDVGGEVWLDELDHYTAEVEKCPGITQRAGL